MWAVSVVSRVRDDDPIAVLRRMQQDEFESAQRATKSVDSDADKLRSAIATPPVMAQPGATSAFYVPASDKFEPVVGDWGWYRSKPNSQISQQCEDWKIYRWNCVRAPNNEPWILFQHQHSIASGNLKWFASQVEIIDPDQHIRELVASAPEMTERQRQQQKLSFAYGNLAISRKPNRAAFKKIAVEEYGWTEVEFNAWADTCSAWAPA